MQKPGFIMSMTARYAPRHALIDSALTSEILSRYAADKKNILELDLEFTKEALVDILNKRSDLTLTGSRAFRSEPSDTVDYDFFGRINDNLISSMIKYGFGARLSTRLTSPGARWDCISLTHYQYPFDVFLFDDDGYRSYLKGHRISKDLKLRDLISDKEKFLTVFHAMCGRELPGDVIDTQKIP